MPTHEKLFAVGKMAQMPLLTSVFLGSVGPWVGEFVGFIIIVICSPTQQNLVIIANMPSTRNSLYIWEQTGTN